MGIEILLGEDGLAAVAKAEAAAEAQASAEEEMVDSGSASPRGEPGAARTKGVHAEVDTKNAREATGVSASAADAAKPAGGRAQDRDSAGMAPSGDGKTSPRRWLALEVEVHACGDIDVPYLMALIKVCFEQVPQYGIKAADNYDYLRPPALNTVLVCLKACRVNTIMKLVKKKVNKAKLDAKQNGTVYF